VGGRWEAKQPRRFWLDFLLVIVFTKITSPFLEQNIAFFEKNIF